GYLLWRMRGRAGAVTAAVRHAGMTTPVPVFALAVVIGVMMSRSWTVNVFQAFTPTWYEQLGYGPAFYGPLATTLVLASAVGTVGVGVPINGAIADAIGLQKSLMTHAVLVIITIGIAWFLPREDEVERYSAQQEALRTSPEQV